MDEVSADLHVAARAVRATVCLSISACSSSCLKCMDGYATPVSKKRYSIHLMQDECILLDSYDRCEMPFCKKTTPTTDHGTKIPERRLVVGVGDMHSRRLRAIHSSTRLF